MRFEDVEPLQSKSDIVLTGALFKGGKVDRQIMTTPFPVAPNCYRIIFKMRAI